MSGKLARASRETGVPWTGRPTIGRTGLRPTRLTVRSRPRIVAFTGSVRQHILALGISPAIGFIHTGKMLSFVYDVADLLQSGRFHTYCFFRSGRGPGTH